MKILNYIIFCLALFLVLSGFPAVRANAAAQAPITRSQAEKRALDMINLSWQYTITSNGTIPAYSSIVTQPSQLSSLKEGTLTGIPYDWGGSDSLDFSSAGAPWSNFLDAVERGAYAGNVNITSGYGYIPGTAGIDCSGFVQAVFNIKDSKLSTYTLFNNYFVKINLSDIKHMDILDRPSDHVVIFDRWGTLNGVYGAFTYESTPDTALGGIQGTKKYFLSMDEINNGYIPGRYVNIVDDSQNLPYPVNAGVFARITNVNEWANFRSAPSTGSSLQGTIPLGTILYLIDYQAGWYQVSYNGQVGWVWGNLIGSIPSGKYVSINGAYCLNIRISPSSSSSIAGTLGQNQYAEVLGYSQDGAWFRININGITGWAYSKYLRYIY